MKKNFIIAGILAGIALICAVCIAGINMVTSPVIDKNTKKKELETCQSIFEDYDEDKSEEKDVDGKTIIKKVLAKNKSGEELGYLYTVTGKNSYGVITLMVAVKDGNIYQVEFLENGQSFASTVVGHVKENYPSSEDTTIHIGVQPAESETVGSLDSTNGIDTSCGATYGANLVKELVQAALDDAKGVK